MSLVTITTDLGYRDPYLAIVKAKLIISNPGIQIIDLSCDIKDNNISDAAFILKNSLDYFPAGTIHLVAVKFISTGSGLNRSNSADNTRYLLSTYRDQFIVTPDNGLFTLLDQNFNGKVYQLYYENNSQHHFFLKDIFTEVATHLLKQKKIEDIGLPTTDYYRAVQFESFVDRNILRGKGIYADDFGNIITNITKEQFEKVIGKKNFSITLPGTRITTISNTYDEVQHGYPVVLFNSFDHLEVAINGGSAIKMLCKREPGNKFDFNLIIEFND